MIERLDDVLQRFHIYIPTATAPFHTLTDFLLRVIKQHLDDRHTHTRKEIMKDTERTQTIERWKQADSI